MSKGKLKNSKLWGYEEEYFHDDSNKIELEHCKSGGNNCKELLGHINNSYRDYYKFYRIKDYKRSVNALESAYMNSYNLKQKQCLKCADLFRNMMIQSLEKMHKELKKQKSGLFKSKRHQSNYEIIDNALNFLKQKNNSAD